MLEFFLPKPGAIKKKYFVCFKNFCYDKSYKCLPVLKITIQDYPAKLHSLKAACTNENCLSKPMDKSIYWEAFLTINIGRGKKQRKTIANSNLFQRNELVFQILFNTFSQGIADFECLDFKRSFQGL